LALARSVEMTIRCREREWRIFVDQGRCESWDMKLAESVSRKVDKVVVTLVGSTQYPWVLRQSRYCGYCRWVLQGTVGTAGTVCTAQYPWVLQGTVGTVGTARAKVTVGYCGSTRRYCRVLWALWVLQGVKATVGYCTVRAGTAGYCVYCGYCRVLGTVGTAGVYCRVLQGVQKVRALSAVRNTYGN
jgi:hypothetical protein